MRLSCRNRPVDAATAQSYACLGGKLAGAAGPRVGTREGNVLTDRLVIVGAGQAGFALAANLRALKETRPVTMRGAGDGLPYQLQPLSKKYLSGTIGVAGLSFRPEQ